MVACRGTMIGVYLKMEPPKVINNISERVIDDLQKKLSIKSTVSIAAASFSIYAYDGPEGQIRWFTRQGQCS